MELFSGKARESWTAVTIYVTRSATKAAANTPWRAPWWLRLRSAADIQARLAAEQAVSSPLLEDINLAGAEATAAAIGENAIPLGLEVSQEAAWTAAMTEVVDRFGKLDILANIAGIGVPGNIMELTMPDWHRMVAVNLTGVILGFALATAKLVYTCFAGYTG